MSTIEYRRTLFDRHGPDAVLILRAWSYGLLIGIATGLALLLRGGYHWWIWPIAALAGILGGTLGFLLATRAGAIWQTMFTSGSSTPYVEQYSYQQALVMRGQVDEALDSFERIIAENPAATAATILAAELYAQERRDYRRAAELFRQAQRITSLSARDDIYMTNRLVDLLLGPLDDPRRALAELRRLIDRYPDSQAAANARSTIRDVKAKLQIEPLA